MSYSIFHSCDVSDFKRFSANFSSHKDFSALILSFRFGVVAWTMFSVCFARRALATNASRCSVVSTQVVLRPFSSQRRAKPSREDPTAEPVSNRRQFKHIPVNPKLLQSIRDQQVCKPMRQARSRKVDRYIRRSQRGAAAAAEALPPRPRLPPPPFGPLARPVRIRHSMRAHDKDIAGSLDKLNPQKIPTVALCGRSNVGACRRKSPFPFSLIVLC